MCGRYRRTTAEEEIARQYHVAIPFQLDLHLGRRPFKPQTALLRCRPTAGSSCVWRSQTLQFGHFQRFITAGIVDILGRGGLNHGGVANDVGRGALAEGLGLNLFAQECYQVLAGGTPSGTAPLG